MNFTKLLTTSKEKR